MGVVAPKDPEKKRPGFYIMRNKDVFGSEQPDGKGVQFLYMSDGRIVSGAKIVGGITDEEMLKMLIHTADFRKLVYSIGVTAEMDEVQDIDFVFQMYGKTDPYRSGTTIRQTVRTDGMEVMIKMDEVNWSEDDDVIGQIRFEMKEAKQFAKVAVKLYLMDGFTAPEPEEEEQVDFEAPEYEEMIKQSLLSLGDTKRLQKAILKAKAGEDVTIAYIGGSITQGAGAIPINTECYAYKSFCGFCQLAGRGTDENIHYVKAGVGGTPSELGMLRYERDVLRNGTVSPDVVVVEFAVNDEGDETKGDCYEALVRKILKSEQAPAVVLMFSVFADDYNLQERLAPVGASYQVPMVSVKDCVVPQFYDKEKRVISKNQYFYDCFHPTNLGHKIMADGLIYLFEKANEEALQMMSQVQNDPKKALLFLGGCPVDLDDLRIVYSKEFEDVKLFDRKETMGISVDPGDFALIDEELQAVEMDLNLFQTPEFPNNWKHSCGTKPLSMDVTCSALIMINKDSASANAGIAEVYVDGEKVLTVNPRLNGWIHCNPLICFRGRECKKVHVEVKMQPGDENKEFTILGFGIVR